MECGVGLSKRRRFKQFLSHRKLGHEYFVVSMSFLKFANRIAVQSRKFGLGFASAVLVFDAFFDHVLLECVVAVTRYNIVYIYCVDGSNGLLLCVALIRYFSG